MSKLRFDGRAVLITGAGRGTGRAHALMLAERGARVLVSDTGTSLFGTGADAAPALETLEAIRSAGSMAEAYPADLTDPAAAREAVDATAATSGEMTSGTSTLASSRWRTPTAHCRSRCDHRTTSGGTCRSRCSISSRSMSTSSSSASQDLLLLPASGSRQGPDG